MFIENIKIQNYKCLSDLEIKNLNVPNGKKGSGLNVLTAENGCGKTSVLEAIDLLKRKEKYFKKVCSKVNASFLIDIAEYIRISANSDTWFIEIQRPYFNNFEEDCLKSFDSWFYKCSKSNPKVEYIKCNKKINTIREMPECFKADSKYMKYQYRYGVLVPRDIGYVLNILNHIFTERKYMVVKTGGLFNRGNNLYISDSSMQYKNKEYKPSNMFPVRQLGSGVLSVFTLCKKLVYNFTDNLLQDFKNIPTLLIDEPELHLHPLAQEDIAKFLLNESENQQIIIATHSTYIIKALCTQTKENTQDTVLPKFITLKRDEKGTVICNDDKKQFNLFPCSPSYNEINYVAFNMIEDSFHNELYGRIFELYQEIHKKYTYTEFDSFLEKEHNQMRNKKWIREKGKKPKDYTLHRYIRDSIHHPENQLNPKYSQKELRKSIEEMLKILEKMNYDNEKKQEELQNIITISE